jgi:hypothetical protein|eukprot:CAMPEP_0174285486 /NCGR_PEP_ID=MMETSP0809-20121228/8896_1 /TAXON_ID=73025 ORGANISM="Eutreptiella gymnastica-like, Strain CCMP1594" /NCGR_SAMPLE_ID=MMETSP0809 /ASSEMBLY_ACC=CAM_ASM_000658 /LENGTH=195 /DNA_ID=CAMNT_0015381281 /DNA_START=25 /DNA_END=612 /DNA_ORIENTATION=-
MKKRNTLRAATQISFEGNLIEYSVHKSSRLLSDEVKVAFPIDTFDAKSLNLVITFQPSSCELIEWTDEAAVQKDLKLEIFVKWANDLRNKLNAEGHWADFTDPACGFPVHSGHGSQPFSDVSGCEACLPYRFHHISGSAGGCRVITHPQWRLACYPATFFTTAPEEALFGALDSFESWVAAAEDTHQALTPAKAG